MKSKIGLQNRVYIQLPMTLCGTDMHGNAFKEQSVTVILTREGAWLKSNTHLAKGARLSLETPHKVCLQAQVVQVGGVSTTNANQIEVHCPQLANTMGIYFSPVG